MFGSDVLLTVIICLQLAFSRSLTTMLCMHQVLVDVNWRPVFWPDQSAAPGIIREYCERADILKLSDEEAELLYSIPRAEALQHADKVQLLLLCHCKIKQGR